MKLSKRLLFEVKKNAHAPAAFFQWEFAHTLKSFRRSRSSMHQSIAQQSETGEKKKTADALKLVEMVISGLRVFSYKHGLTSNYMPTGIYSLFYRSFKIHRYWWSYRICSFQVNGNRYLVANLLITINDDVRHIHPTVNGLFLNAATILHWKSLSGA